MRLLIATGLFPPDVGGPATYTKLLLEHLPRRGIETSVLAFGEVRSLPKLIRHLAYFLKVFRRGKGVDLIYAQDPVSVGFPAALAALVLRKRFFVRIAGDYAWEQGVQRFGVKDSLDDFAGKRVYSLSVRILKRVQRFTALCAERIIVPSEYMKKIVHAWGISLDKISVVYSSVESVPNLPSKEELRGEFGFGDRRVMVSAGRLVPWKGMNELLGLIPDLRARFSDFLFLIAGEGPLREDLIAKVSELGIGVSVRFLGRLDRNELFRYVKASDVFVLNSTYEGFSHQLLESLLLGTPTVALDVGGNAELIKSGEEGLLVEPHKKEELFRAITTILSDVAKAESFAESGKKKAERFGSEHMLTELVKILR